MIICCRYNSVSCIKIDNKSFLYNRNDIGSQFVNYFKNLFTTYNPIFDTELDDLFVPFIFDSKNATLCETLDEFEIFLAVLLLLLLSRQ